MVKLTKWFNSLSIDKKAVNDNGQTAYQYLSASRNDLCPYTIIRVQKQSSASTIGYPVYLDSPKKTTIFKYLKGGC